MLLVLVGDFIGTIWEPFGCFSRHIIYAFVVRFRWGLRCNDGGFCLVSGIDQL